MADFRDHLRRGDGQAVATINRALVAVRRLFDYLVRQGHVTANPAIAVKELRRQTLAPKGMERSEVRKLLREVELRGDVRANAIFTFILCTGCRVSDAVDLEIYDLTLSERSGSVVFRNGKGNKQRSVPLPLLARRALAAYLEIRPAKPTTKVFVGERGALHGAWVPQSLRQVQRHHWREAPSPPAAAHDGPSVLGRQQQRLGFVGAGNPGPRESEHDGPIHETDGAAAWRGHRAAQLLNGSQQLGKMMDETRAILNKIILALVLILGAVWWQWSAVVKMVIQSDLGFYAHEIRAAHLPLPTKERLLDRTDDVERRVDDGKKIGFLRWWRIDTVVRELLAGGLDTEKARMMERELQRAG